MTLAGKKAWCCQKEIAVSCVPSGENHILKGLICVSLQDFINSEPLHAPFSN